MADLEDRILRKNVPGRWTSNDEKEKTRRGDGEYDNVDGSGTEDDAHDALTEEQELIEYAKKMDFDGVPDPVKRKILAERENMPGTGVKGVLADYKTHMKLQNAQKVAEEEQRKQLLHRMVTGVSRPTDASESRTMTAADHAMVSLQIAINKKGGSGKGIHEPESVDVESAVENALNDLQSQVQGGSDDDDDYDIDDDDFLSVFRSQRLAEMQAQAEARGGVSDTALASSLMSGQPLQFGELIEVVDQEEFLIQVDKENALVTVVVHLYDPSLSACRVLNEHLAVIAQMWRDVKFLCMKASLSGVYIDPVALPAISIYRGGECINVITDIAQECVSSISASSVGGRRTGGQAFSREDVQWLLETSEGWIRR